MSNVVTIPRRKPDLEQTKPLIVWPGTKRRIKGGNLHFDRETKEALFVCESRRHQNNVCVPIYAAMNIFRHQWMGGKANGKFTLRLRDESGRQVDLTATDLSALTYKLANRPREGLDPYIMFSLDTEQEIMPARAYQYFANEQALIAHSEWWRG
jgi:hypothetical protein